MGFNHLEGGDEARPFVAGGAGGGTVDKSQEPVWKAGIAAKYRCAALQSHQKHSFVTALQTPKTLKMLN